MKVTTSPPANGEARPSSPRQRYTHRNSVSFFQSKVWAKSGSNAVSFLGRDSRLGRFPADLAKVAVEANKALTPSHSPAKVQQSSGEEAISSPASVSSPPLVRSFSPAANQTAGDKLGHGVGSPAPAIMESELGNDIGKWKKNINYDASVSDKIGKARETPPITTKNKAFADLFNTVEKFSIAPRDPMMVRWEPIVVFTDEEVQRLAGPLKLALIGKFSHGKPTISEVRLFFANLGLQGEFHVGLIDKKHVLLRFVNEIDYYRIWLRGGWSIKGRLMRVLKWMPNFSVDIESPFVPIWIHFPHLPIHLYNPEALMNIAKVTGSPLKLDMPTLQLSRPSLARVCVQIDLSIDLPTRVWIKNGHYGGFWQDIVYENMGEYCLYCKRLGHGLKLCKFKANDSKKIVKQQYVPKQDQMTTEKSIAKNNDSTEVKVGENPGKKQLDKGKNIVSFVDYVDPKTAAAETSYTITLDGYEDTAAAKIICMAGTNILATENASNEARVIVNSQQRECIKSMAADVISSQCPHEAVGTIIDGNGLKSVNLAAPLGVAVMPFTNSQKIIDEDFDQQKTLAICADTPDVEFEEIEEYWSKEDDMSDCGIFSDSDCVIKYPKYVRNASLSPRYNCRKNNPDWGLQELIHHFAADSLRLHKSMTHKFPPWEPVTKRKRGRPKKGEHVIPAPASINKSVTRGFLNLSRDY